MSLKLVQHEILQDLTVVANALGRKPSRPEYLQLGKFNTHDIMNAFGSFANLITASNISPNKPKQDKQEIRKKAFEHLKLEVESKKIITPPSVSSKTLIIGDTHFPYTHPDAVQWLITLNRKYGFDLILHASDEVDYHAMNFHDHDPDAFSAGHELEAAIRMMEPLYKEFPNVRLVDSNHGSMVYRKGKHHGFPRQVLKPYGEAICAPPGWTWDDKIRFQTSNGQMNMLVHSLGVNVLSVAQTKGMNVIQGHHHELFGIRYFHNEEKDQIMFGAQTGCLVDDLSYAMAYNKTNKFRPIMGSLALFNGVPKLLPMFLDKHGRWNGVLP